MQSSCRRRPGYRLLRGCHHLQHIKLLIVTAVIDYLSLREPEGQADRHAREHHDRNLPQPNTMLAKFWNKKQINKRTSPRKTEL